MHRKMVKMINCMFHIKIHLRDALQDKEHNLHLPGTPTLHLPLKVVQCRSNGFEVR